MIHKGEITTLMTLAKTTIDSKDKNKNHVHENVVIHIKSTYFHHNSTETRTEIVRTARKRSDYINDVCVKSFFFSFIAMSSCHKSRVEKQKMRMKRYDEEEV